MIGNATALVVRCASVALDGAGVQLKADDETTRPASSCNLRVDCMLLLVKKKVRSGEGVVGTVETAGRVLGPSFARVEPGGTRRR